MQPHTNTTLDRSRRQRSISYVTVNAYSHKCSIQQIATIILFVIITSLFSAFIVPASAKQQSAILWMIIGVAYVLLLLVIYDYIYLTKQDPVDRRLLGEETDIKNTQYCLQCHSFVHKQSYHCNTCKRCVQYFDHHCKYLNNCIGGKNYYQFIRMLFTVTGYCLFIIVGSLWVFIGSFSEGRLSQWGDKGVKYGSLITFLLSFSSLLGVDSLLIFHLYLNLYLKTTTYHYLVGSSENRQQQQPPDISRNNIKSEL